MRLSLTRQAGILGTQMLVTLALTLISVVVGVCCVVFPPPVPLGLVGGGALTLLVIMPQLQRVPWSISRAMIAPFLFATICVPVYYAIIIPGLPWISIRKVLNFSLVIPSCITLGGSLAARKLVVDVIYSQKLLCLTILIFIFVTLFTTLTSIHFVSSLNFFILNVLSWYLPMVAVILCIRDVHDVRKIFKFFIWGVALNFAAGVVESYLHRPFLVYLLPPFMRQQIFESNGILLQNLTLGMGERSGSYRASATFTTALSWGEICAMMTPMCLHFIGFARSRSDRIYGIVGLLMCFGSIVLSGSRGAYVGMIAAAVSYSVMFAFRLMLRDRGSLAGAIWLTLFSMSSVAVIASVFFVSAVRRAVLGGGEAQHSTDSRYIEWALAKPKIWAKPLQGYGGGTAAEVIGYMSSLNAYSVDGYYMNLLVDYGILGFILFFLMFSIAIFAGFNLFLRSRSEVAQVGAALGSSLLAFVLYRISLSQIDSLSIAFCLVGMVVVCCHAAKFADRGAATPVSETRPT